QAAIAGLEQDIEHFLFRDGVADLHGPAADAFGLGAKLDRRESGAVDAVPAGAPADGDDEIVGLGLLTAAFNRDKPDGAAEHQGIGEVTFVEADGAVHGGDAHAIAVVADPGHDAADDAARMQYAGWQRFRRCVRQAETEYVGIADGLGPQASA